jgi:hypothetical protein
VLTNDGQLHISNDYGVSWSSSGVVLDAAEKGRMSISVDQASAAGMKILGVQGSDVFEYDGSLTIIQTLPFTLTAVDLINATNGYVAGNNSTHLVVWQFNGTGLEQVFSVAQSGFQATGIAAHYEAHIWLTTQNPDVMYFYDGQAWEYSPLGGGQLSTVVVSFGNLTAGGIQDLSMSSSREGYVVGADGLILKLNSPSEARFNVIMDQLSALNQSLANINLSGLNLSQFNFNLSQFNLSNLNISVNLSGLNISVNLTGDVLAYLQDINATLNTEFNTTLTFLDQMNQSVQFSLNNALTNLTYTQLYLQTEIQPMLNSTYQNTILILQQMGILEAQVNETIRLQNETLGIVNQTAQDIDLLLNRSNRMRSWVTP